MLKMIRYFLFCLLMSRAAWPLAADCPPAPMQPGPEEVKVAQQQARDRGFLWRISKDGHASYLYGTIHVAKFEWMFPGPGVLRALKQSDTVALEMDMLDTGIRDSLESSLAALPVMEMPEALLARMKTQAASMCVAYDAMFKLPPEMQVTTLTMMVGRRAGLEASYSIDVLLASIGHAAGKEVISLETPELQMQVLKMPGKGETLAFVEHALDDLESGLAYRLIKQVGSVWESSDYAAMEHYHEWCECLDTETDRAMMKRALDDRNPDMAGRLDALHQEGRQVFAAVGSMHMFGTLGLPALMEKRGYRVERILKNGR